MSGEQCPKCTRPLLGAGKYQVCEGTLDGSVRVVFGELQIQRDDALAALLRAEQALATTEGQRDLALEMLAYLFGEWEYGTECFEVTDGETLHPDAPLGNAFTLMPNTVEDIVAFLRLTPTANGESVQVVDMQTWEDRVAALAAATSTAAPEQGDPVMCGTLNQASASTEWAKANDGCGEMLDRRESYRCTDCSRWYHRDCIVLVHFGRTVAGLAITGSPMSATDD